MRVAIVTNISSGIGLTREFELLRDFLQDLGHEVAGIQYDEDAVASAKFDLAIFLEVVPRNWLHLSDRRWAWLNPEWTTPQIIEHVDRNFEKIFAKTREGEWIFEQLFPGRVHYTGFLTRDQFDPSSHQPHRLPIFLHLAGNSLLRGTEAVLDAWRWRKHGKILDAPLVVVGTAKFDHSGIETYEKRGAWDLERVRFYDRVDEGKLKELQNMCMFHLLPSGTEGFGHALHEAMSVGGFIITNGAPPMNEIPAGRFLKATHAGNYNLARIYQTDALEIREAVEALYDGPPQAFMPEAVRKRFLDDNNFFVKMMTEHLGSSAKKIALSRSRTDGKKTIAFLGNFEALESTENMVKWALEERLGYRVETLQENKVGIEQLRDAMDWNDLFLWIRTPGWLHVSDKEMFKFLDDLKSRGLPSISMHLDKFWGIPEREKLIGLQPFWMTDHVWTADGSRDESFKERGVNHHWMKPAVSEVYCHPGTPREYFRCDVGFVGAKDYHGEYPFRRKLVEWLEETYDGRFKHITNVRGHELNDFYASARVCVGDHIFSGIQNYYSDRAPETTGRGGFLLYPKTEGLCIPCATYEPQNLEDLHNQIEFWLGREHERREKIAECVEHVMLHDTWTDTMRRILNEARF